MEPHSITSNIKKGSFGHLFESLRSHWAFCLSVAYIYLTTIGMFVSYTSLRRYGINIFDYAETSDFLMAAFRNPLPILSYLGAIAYWVFVWFFMTYTMLEKSRRKDVSFFATPMIINLVVSAVAIPILLSLYMEKSQRSPKSAVVISTIDQPPVTVFGNLVGSCKRFLFINSLTNGTTAVPVTNISRIEYIESENPWLQLLIFDKENEELSEGKNGKGVP